MDLNEQLEFPFESVAVQGKYVFVLPVSVAEKVGTTPITGACYHLVIEW